MSEMLAPETQGAPRNDNGPWEQITRTASDFGADMAERASQLGRRLRESGLQERVGGFIEHRPWTALVIALGVGAAMAAAAGGRPRRVGTGVRPADEGDDYLAEYEDALVAGSGRWADRGRDAVRPPTTGSAAPRPTAAAPEDEWRPSDAELSGEHDPMSEMGRGPGVNPGAMESRVTPDTWGRGMIE